MKTEKNIRIAFFLNLAFSVFEWIGGIVTGSVAVLSDALHDFGDAVSIGLAYLLERKSLRKPDGRYTCGYARYSVLGSAVTAVILLAGSCMVVYHAVLRLAGPVRIDCNGMIVFAAVGICVNGAGAFLTHETDGSMNQRAVSLHLLEDVLGWAAVLLGAVVMKFTEIVWLDPVLSIGTALFILYHAAGMLREVLELFLGKTPQGMDAEEIQAHLAEIDGVEEIHGFRLWNMDGRTVYAVLHVVTDAEGQALKENIREELREHGIVCAAIEFEREGERCPEKDGFAEFLPAAGHRHSHGHSHHH